MVEPVEKSRPAIVADILEQICADKESGEIRSLEEYQTRFSGFEGAVAREYEALFPAGAGEAGGSVAPTIGSFRVLRELGRGGQGVVYLAEDALDRPVALKVLDGARYSARSVLRLERETRVLSRLEHPGICPVYERGEHGGKSWLSMRYVEGITLEERLSRDRAEAGEADPARRNETVAFLERVARVLHAAHEAGVVHRDVKPGNLMIDSRGDPVVLDFGLARLADGSDPAVTCEGEVFGTVHYMSPEQLLGGEVDRRCDVWALGVTLYEALVGRRPFEARTRAEVRELVLKKDPADPRRGGGVPRELWAIMEKALEKDPGRRYADAAVLADDLLAWRERRPVSARPVGPAGRLARWARREPLKAALVPIAAIVVTLAGVLLARWPDADRGLRERRLASAEMMLEEAYALFPSDAERSREIFDRALAEHPDSAEALLGAARAYVKLDRPIVALELLDRHQDLVARRPLLRWIEVVALEKLDRNDEADELAAALESETPETDLDHFILGIRELDLRTGGTAEAARRALDHFTKAILYSSRVREVYYFARAGAAITCGDREVALETADLLEIRFPHRAKAWVWIGNAVASHDRERAIRAYTRAIELAPDRSEGYYNRGVIHANCARPQAALADFTAALERDPDHAQALAGRGLAHISLHDDAAALADLARAIEIEPRLAKALNNRAHLRVRRGELALAIADYDAALAFGPNNDSLRVNRARCHLMTGNLADAEHDYEVAARVAPDSQRVRDLAAALERERAARREEDEALQRHLADPSAATTREERLAVVAAAVRRRSDEIAVDVFERLVETDERLAAQPLDERFEVACAAVRLAARPEHAAATAKALSWLERQLALWRDRWERDGVTAPRLRRALLRWRDDDRLARMRAPGLVPESERAAWVALWEEHRELLEELEM